MVTRRKDETTTTLIAGAKTTTITEHCYLSQQSWIYKHIARVDAPAVAARVLVVIERNAYDFQSHARLSRWDGDAWQVVLSEPIEAQDCKHVSYVDRAVTAAAFRSDFNRLVATALKIFGA